MTGVRCGWRVLLLIAAVVPLATANSGAQGPSTVPITIAWDPNPEFVNGYRVHIGTSSGDYSEIVDVPRTQTTYTFRNAERGTTYYFAVQAWIAGRYFSPKSEEVSTIAGSSEPPVSASPVTPIGANFSSVQRSSFASPAQIDSSISADCDDSTRCYRLDIRARGLEAVTAIGVADDNTLLVAEQGRRVLVVPPGSTSGVVAVVADAGSLITDIVPDPRFASTRHVYVGVTQSATDGFEFSVVRYRLLQDRLGEAAVLVSRLASRGPRPRLALDSGGSMYVAMPALDASRSDPYAGMILRFDANGLVPVGSRAASPVLAYGFVTPTGLSAVRGGIVASGLDSTSRHRVARLSLATAAAATAWPDRLEEVSGFEGGEAPGRLSAVQAARPDRAGVDQTLAIIEESSLLHLTGVDGKQRRRIGFHDASGTMALEGVAFGFDDRIYVALRSLGGSSSVVMLDARQ
jgi:Fibronectin type III domain/Glucose / Sorbosone dehydrogenase